jgi:predicted nuclease with TOPRIM domain
MFVVCLGLIEWLWHRHELKRTARQWDERERLLDRPVTTPQDIVEPQEHIEHLAQENERLRAERDELLAAFQRLADLVEQIRGTRAPRTAPDEP